MLIVRKLQELRRLTLRTIRREVRPSGNRRCSRATIRVARTIEFALGQPQTDIVFERQQRF